MSTAAAAMRAQALSSQGSVLTRKHASDVLVSVRVSLPVLLVGRGWCTCACACCGEITGQVVHHIIKKEDDGRTSKEGGNTLMTAVAVNRPMEQLLHTLMLANELLPPPEVDERATKLVADIACDTQLVQDLFGQPGAAPLLREFSESRPALLVEYSALLYPILVDISVTIVNEVR
jgi:hypothetical protein